MHIIYICKYIHRYMHPIDGYITTDRNMRDLCAELLKEKKR